jgi:anti-sigma factor RsiW
MTTSFHDVELISAYLDGQLNPSDSARLESRLQSDENLRTVLDDLREARGILRQLPQRRAPRNFTLTPKMAGIKPPAPRAYPIFRLATAVATLLFLITFVVNGLSPIAAPRLAAAPAPAFGMGGGFGGGPPNETAPLAPATQAPAQPYAAQSLAATGTPAVTNDNSRVLAPATTTPELAPKAAVPAPLNGAQLQVQDEAPVSFVWQIALGILALICGMVAWFLRLLNDRKFRRQWDRK